MSSITVNQKLAFLARAQDDARRLAASLCNLPEGERAAMLALAARQSNTPVDITMVGEPGDWRDAWQASATLKMTSDHRWEIGSGCHLQIVELPR